MKLLPLVACVGLLGSAPAQNAPSFPEDVDFLLTEFGSKAKNLLQLKGIDWTAVRREFTAAAGSAATDDQKYKLVARLVAQLQDGHAGIVKSKLKPNDESQGRRYTGPRVMLAVSEGKVLVRNAFKDASEAGLRSGQEVISIDGSPALTWLNDRVKVMRDQGNGYSTPRQALYAACHWGLADWEGTPITFEIRDASGSAKSIKRIRNGGPNFVPIGPIFPPAGLKAVGRQSFGQTKEGFGYIHLRDIPANLPRQIDQMLSALGAMPGLILDLRANGGGGCNHGDVMGRFLAKGEQWGAFEGLSDHPFTGKIVVIVDAGVRSAGEIIAGMFKETGRAYLIGDSPTAGMSSQKVDITTPSGQFTVHFSVATNMSKYNQGRGIEAIGISPHELVPLKAADLLNDEDTLIKRAIEILQKGFPEDTVDYEAK